MHLGKALRLERIVNRNTGRTIIVPLDHGVTVGPIYGLVDLRETVDKVAEGGANAVLMHKGLVRCGHREHGRDVGLIVHLSASTALSPYPNAKTLVGSVEDESERQMLSDLGNVSSRAAEWGIPVLAMVYARGPKIENEFDPQVVAHCARLGEELGADVVKVVYTGDIESFSKVVDACCVPVVIAGGPKLENTRQLVQMVHDSIEAGGAGLSVGRNIFQAEAPDRLVRALHQVVHEDYSVEQALSLLESGE